MFTHATAVKHGLGQHIGRVPLDKLAIEGQVRIIRFARRGFPASDHP